ncbi:Os11g0245466, partial [Oryza sativa Japonica Group]
STSLEAYIYHRILQPFFNSFESCCYSCDVLWLESEQGRGRKRASKSDGNRNMEESLKLNFLLQYRS